ncbi:hypothetical protein CK203_079789 [Vitis vinifera]|uniref:Uncharacterized protein n=1 Tax=Vitis vinifera TaxID=29760 RepID=A0A438ECN2_VITVI|nr:hypothetical protein CK203_079789 [Vitis vinifera]
MPTEKVEKRYPFTKKQFNAGLRFPLPALFKEFLHSSRIPPSSFIPTLSGADGMQHYNMLYSLDLTLLELFFVYSLKKAKNDIFKCVHSPALPSNGRTARFDKGRGEGAGGRPPCGLGGKGSFACVCKLFEIDPRRGPTKHCFPAEFDRGRPGAQEYVINILPRKLANDEIVHGEHYTVKELPLYQEAKEADAERRRKLLEDRDQKKTEGTIRKAPGQKGGPDPPSKKIPGKMGKLVKKHGKDVKEPTPPRSSLLPKLL